MNRLLIVALALGLAPAAPAQETSDLMPPAPQPPAGSAGVYYPGMPVPQAAPPAEERGAAPAAKAPEGRYLFAPGVEEEPTEAAPGGAPEVPGTYTVRRGDTLWDISASFFKNPWYWPKLWAMNPSITNPHWIYPGDLLRLGEAEAAAAPPSAKPPQVIEAPPMDTGLYLRDNAFVEPGELAASSEIVASKEEKRLLSTLDEAYVRSPKDHPLVIGARYSVYHPIREVRHPVTGKKVGAIVEVFGDVVVKSIDHAGIATVQVVDSSNPIERSFRVGPLRRTFRRIAPHAADRNLRGVVVATLSPIGVMAPEQLCFVDRGREDGVTLGQRLYVIRRGDGYRPITKVGPFDDPKYPREVVGQMVVVDLRDHLSTSVMLASDKEVNVGDGVESRAGN